MAEPVRDPARRLWILALVAGLAAAGVWWSSSRRTTPASSVAGAVGAGRPLLLDFGMDVCTQCKRLKPVMEQAARELGDQIDVHVLDIRQDQNDRLAQRFKVTSLPLIVLVDGAGDELWRHEGFVDFPELSRAVEQRLGAGGLCTPAADQCRP